MTIMNTLRSLARALAPRSDDEAVFGSETRNAAGVEGPVGEALLLAALEAQSLPEPWSVRDGLDRSGSWIGLQGEDERLDVVRCVLESLRPNVDRVSDVYLRHAMTLVVRESEPRGGVSERQYLIGVPAKDTRPIE